MSCAVATQADTSSNQAIKDPGRLRRGNSNLGKILSQDDLWLPDVCGCNLWLRALPEYSCFPTSSDLKQKVAPVRSQQMLSEATHFRLFNLRLSLPLFLFSQIVSRSALNELDFQP
jgi:hypothetical protein